MYEYIKVENSDGIAKITINRPDVYNALNRASKLELIQAIGEASHDNSINVILLTGEGKAFCSGQDLNDRKGGETSSDLGNTLKTEWNPLVNAIRLSHKIVVAAINGVTAGAGISVAMACDLIIAPPRTRFVSGFTKLGLVPDAGSTSTFTKCLGPKKAMEFFIFGTPMLSEYMEEVGLINEVSDEPYERGLEICEQIKGMAPLALEHLKKNITAANEVDFQTSMDNETLSQSYLGTTEDFNEGVTAFFEKRTAVFKGR